MIVNCGKPTFGFIQAILGAQFVDKITKYPKKKQQQQQHQNTSNKKESVSMYFKNNIIFQFIN